MDAHEVTGEVITWAGQPFGHEVLAVAPVLTHPRGNRDLLGLVGSSPGKGHPVAAPALEQFGVGLGETDQCMCAGNG